MKFIKAKNYEDMSVKAAHIIAAQMLIKEDSVLGLATGSTPEGLYAELVKEYEAGYLDFSKITTVNLDEYKGIDRENPESYYYYMHDNLFSHVNIKEENVNLPNGMEPDAEKECARYDAVIEATGGIDLQLLGVGHNGHIAFNEPADAFTKGTSCISLTERTIQANKRFFEREEDVPRQAYTMGIKTIMSAEKILMVVNGKEKAETVRDAFFGPITPKVPASVLQLHKNVIVVGDEEAFSLCDI